MFNPTSVVASAFGDYLADLYLQYFSGRDEGYAAYIGGAARLVLERLGNSDALYHNSEHTMMVTLVGQQIIRGRLLSEALQAEDWLHYTVALLVHDIGYARGVCKGDRDGKVVINSAGDTVTPKRGASDASLAPYHIERGMIYARERFGQSPVIDEERIARAIDYTRFPVPDEPEYAATDTEPALVRAADLIGQMGDPFYHRKINGLYHEFVEVGTAEKLGYESPFDLVERYPEFFWTQVQPYIGAAQGYLEQTIEGKQWVAQLYNHIFQADQRRSCLGPYPGPARV
ncbi:MAG TPA: metal-dependent phosphohydrolase [Afifellaceae bacterium]|nr:metal-dependent phosphohydrolase [Afifellaceae bacterium]